MTAPEITFLVSRTPGGGFSARAEGASIFTEADSLGQLRAAVRDAVRCHFDEGSQPSTIRLRLYEDLVFPLEPIGGRNWAGGSPRELGPGWFAILATTLLSGCLLFGCVRFVNAGLHDAEDVAMKLLVITLGAAFALGAFLIARTLLWPRLWIDAERIKQRSAFRRGVDLPWEEIAFVRYAPSSDQNAIFMIGDGGSRTIELSTFNSRRVFQVVASALLEQCPADILAEDPPTLLWLQGLVEDSLPLRERPL